MRAYAKYVNNFPKWCGAMSLRLCNSYHYSRVHMVEVWSYKAKEYPNLYREN